MKTPKYDAWLENYTKGGWNATILLISQAVEALKGDHVAHENDAANGLKSMKTQGSQALEGDHCEAQSEPAPASINDTKAAMNAPVMKRGPGPNGPPKAGDPPTDEGSGLPRPRLA